jgi:hypothetical protein
MFARLAFFVENKLNGDGFLKKTLYLMLVLASFTYRAVYGGELQPFTTDGCSAFPEGTPAQNELWLDCCLAHDRAYWKGGTASERELADLELLSCVSKVGEPEIAALMKLGVRVGGSPYWPSRFRWGYGWAWPHFYGPLTEEELDQVKALESE